MTDDAGTVYVHRVLKSLEVRMQPMIAASMLYDWVGCPHRVTMDLYYDVVLKATEWPTRDFSIKTLATYLGFSWRDTHPSGAASIEMFHRWVETGDLELKERILEYNEDDCRATRVLLDGIRGLSPRGNNY